MLELSEYKNTVDNASIPVIIGLPILKGSIPVDFKVLYINKAFKEEFPGLEDEGALYSTLKSKLTSDMPWAEATSKTIATHKKVVHSFYSPKYSRWYKVILNTLRNDLIFFSLTDITQDKKYQERLKNQNLKLASLTKELSLSKENFRSKIEEVEALNEELCYIAYHDTLTGIYNKQKLNEDLLRCQREFQKSRKKFGITLIDLDNMKLINDAQGHFAGDAVICNAALILKNFVRENIHAYRFSGDEFIVLAEGLDSRNTLLNIADAILETFNAQGIEFSGGISLYPDDTNNLEELLKFADMAMYDVKKKTKNNIGVFQRSMQEKFLSRLTLQNKISPAIQNNEFSLYYQPQFDVETGKLRGFEALLRWYDKKLGWISPEQFISIAEESRLIIPLGEWVMDTALSTLSEWCHKYSFNEILSVNVSPVQLKKTDFLFWLDQKIKQYKINPANLEIEITEGVLIDNKEETVKLLKQIRQMGVKVSLDDFGTGYSSLNYLQILPITTLKIDKSFIANLTSKTEIEANITDSIINMVSKMGLDTIAEGVENLEQLNILKQIRCKTIQGFLKGKPMEKDRCARMLSGDNSAILSIENEVAS
ncbi:putative bifunctional diguanylate cyclase/phosphodiesterase [Treponema pectinovorum]|uniref:putative bifunctional diguanylate cyclase/phosphodiesterase n=1 Tax=Treponema pectinovorum TaxID=164 RepID=UPI0011F1EBCA|nr:GGDEF domain-containing phosphodiesterase [Treponema pectinovorum]